MNKPSTICQQCHTYYEWLPGAPGQGVIMHCPQCGHINPLKKRGRPPGPYGEYNKIRIGADPEFELYRNGKPFPANQVLQGLHSPVGVDGNSSTGELRPRLKSGGRVDTLFYGDGSKKGYEGFSILLDQLALKLDEMFEVFGGSGREKPLGGHLHFSGVEKDKLLIAALDQFITIPLNEVSDTRLRFKRGYGRLGAIEGGKPHGGWEYRSPLSWISTPDQAKGVLSTAWLLAQAQKHGNLPKFQTFEDFLEYPRKGHAKNIKKFVDFLGELKQSNQKLEQIEVLKAWDKRHLLKPIKTPAKPVPVAWELDDACMPEIATRVGPLTSPMPLRFVGASQSRSSRNAIFLPAGWEVDLPRLTRITSQQWNLPWIGLSWRLRQNPPLAAQVIRAVVSSVNRPTQ